MELAGDSGVQLSFDAEVDANVIVIKQQLHAAIFSANRRGQAGKTLFTINECKNCSTTDMVRLRSFDFFELHTFHEISL